MYSRVDGAAGVKAGVAIGARVGVAATGLLMGGRDVTGCAGAEGRGGGIATQGAQAAATAGAQADGAAIIG